jgi:hypothetical protein
MKSDLTILTKSGKLLFEPLKNKYRVRGSKNLLLKIMWSNMAVLSDDVGPYIDLESKKDYLNIVQDLIKF